MEQVYINAKNFKNDEISLMFGKDLVSIDELVDKIYELQDTLEETQQQLENANEELYYTQQELSAVKLGINTNI